MTLALVAVSDCTTKAMSSPVRYPRPTPQYTYNSIGGDQIRLVQLTSAPKSERLCLAISTFTREAAPGYIALSYEWGGPRNSQAVYIGPAERPLTVRAILLAFLRRLESDLWNAEGHAQYLWADAICIDQDNTRERNSQVAVMGQIFSNAEAVFGWIGNVRVRSSRLIARSFEDTREKPYDITKKEKSIPGLAESLDRIGTRTFWVRVWIVQVTPSDCQVRCHAERSQGIIFAKKMIIYCGSTHIQIEEIWRRFCLVEWNDRPSWSRRACGSLGVLSPFGLAPLSMRRAVLRAFPDCLMRLSRVCYVFDSPVWVGPYTSLTC
jgi:hypothetical protein